MRQDNVEADIATWKYVNLLSIRELFFTIIFFIIIYFLW